MGGVQVLVNTVLVLAGKASALQFLFGAQLRNLLGSPVSYGFTRR
jgi:hypothetical protein